MSLDPTIVKSYLGKYVTITWTEDDGSTGSMEGWLIQFRTDYRLVLWADLDDGIGIEVVNIGSIAESTPGPNAGKPTCLYCSAELTANHDYEFFGWGYLGCECCCSRRAR